MKKRKAVAALAGLLAAIYAAGCVYFGGHLFPGTTVDGEDASFLDRAEVQKLLEERAAQGTLTVRAKGETFVLDRAGIASAEDAGQSAGNLFRRPVSLWPAECLRRHELHSGQKISFSRERAAQLLESEGVFSYSEEPVDARISEFEEGRGYTVIPDEDGFRAEREQLLDAVGDAVTAGATELDLTDTFSVRASVTADDAELNRICSEKNALVNHSFALKIGDAEQTLSGTELNSWLVTSREGQFGLDDGKITAYAEQLESAFAGKLASLSDASEGGRQYLVDAGRFKRILAACLRVTLPRAETAAEKKARERENSAVLRKAKRDARKAKTEEEKQRILAEAEAAEKPEPEMIALPYVTADSAPRGAAEEDTARGAERNAEQAAAQEAEQQEMRRAVLLDGVYIENLETEEAAQSRKEKALQQLPPATRANALLPDDPEAPASESSPEKARAARAEAVTLPEGVIYVPVVEADPGFLPGFGLDYIDISLENQHVVLYENARRVMESDCVTGLPTKERETHRGVFHINYKQRNRILRGQQKLYASFVNYWMPFDAGIGLHDATWRGKFGGKIYARAGSHGCVNLPLAFAKQLYARIYTGETVYVH